MALFSVIRGTVRQEAGPPADRAWDDRFGAAIAPAGDLDGDGIGDILVGAPWDASQAGKSGGGRVWVFSGKTGAVLRSLSGQGREFGRALAGEVDFDSDAVADIVVASRGRSLGIVTIHSGASGIVLHEITPPRERPYRDYAVSQWTHFGARSVMLSPWRARNRIHLAKSKGASERRAAESPTLEKIDLDLFRRNTIDDVASIGDVDGDGVDDWLAAIDAGRTSEVALISGSDWRLIRALGLPAMGGHLIELGSSLAAAGDLDGDGHADYLVAARIADALVEGQCPSCTGHVFGYSGKTGGLILDLVVECCALDGGWDATGDGLPDILVGSEQHGLALGAFLYSGKDGTLVRKIQGDLFREYVGVNVRFLDDIDGDGCAEVAVANHPTGLHVSQSGEVVVYSGATGEKLHTLRSGR